MRLHNWALYNYTNKVFYLYKLNGDLEHTYTKVEYCQILLFRKNTINFLPQNIPITCCFPTTSYFQSYKIEDSNGPDYLVTQSPDKVGIKYIIRAQQVLGNLKEDQEKKLVGFFFFPPPSKSSPCDKKYCSEAA